MSFAPGGERALLSVLTERGLVTPEQAREVERDAALWGSSLTQTLLARRLVEPAVLAQAISTTTETPLLDARVLPLDPDFAEAPDLDFFVRHHVLPWRREGGAAIIAVVDPYAAEPALRVELGGEPFTMRIVTKDELFRALLECFSERQVAAAISGLAETHPEFSAKGGLTSAQIVVIAVAIAGIAWSFSEAPDFALPIASTLAGVFFITTTLFRVFLMLVSLAPRRTALEEPAPVNLDRLPHYTVLVALYDEAALVPETVHALGQINYPWTKLDILLLLEASDVKTQAACARLPLDGRFTVLTVPDRRPRTKPKACNFGLAFARGDFIALYDAEDRPDPEQLLLALNGFSSSDPGIGCLQAKLNFYNARENWLTSQFALEFAVWFQFILPGLERLRLPIPLGGTSNHFRCDTLRRLGGWDAYNVTEDADLGMRLARQGLRTRTLPSTTEEEANVALPNWIHQRSRWLKGYLQTYLVHMRNPARLAREIGPLGFLSFQLLLGGAVVSPVLHLAFWFGLLAHFVGAPFMAGLNWSPLFTTWNVAVLVIGNGAAILSGLIAAMRSDFRGLGRPSLALTALGMPLYWFLIAFAVFKGLFSYFSRPFYWAKTRHGLSRVNHADFGTRQEVGRRIIKRARSGQA